MGRVPERAFVPRGRDAGGDGDDQWQRAAEGVGDLVEHVGHDLRLHRQHDHVERPELSQVGHARDGLDAVRVAQGLAMLGARGNHREA